MTTDRQTAGIVAVVAASAIWGATFVLAKFALIELEVAHLLLYRFVIAALPFLPILLRAGALPRRRDLKLFALTGFLMVPVTFVLQVEGLALTSATSAALLVGTGAPLLAVAGVLFERERLGRRGWLAVLLSCVGVAILVGAPGPGSDWRGNLLVLLSMLVAVVWVILSKRLVGRYPALHATGWILLFGTLFQIPISLVWAGPPPVDLSSGVWASLVGLGLGCTTLTYVIWNWGVARVGAGAAGVYLNVEPAAGAVFGILVMGDPLGVGVIAGGATILLAAVIVSTRGQAGRYRPTARILSWWLRGRPSVPARMALRQWRGAVGTVRDEPAGARRPAPERRPLPSAAPPSRLAPSLRAWLTAGRDRTTCPSRTGFARSGPES